MLDRIIPICAVYKTHTYPFFKIHVLILWQFAIAEVDWIISCTKLDFIFSLESKSKRNSYSDVLACFTSCTLLCIYSFHGSIFMPFWKKRIQTTDSCI